MNNHDSSIETGSNYYFDNAATSWPKPEAVYKAPEIQLRLGCGNPGRSGHTRTLESDRLIYLTREAVAGLFNIPDPGRVIFSLNATDALNIAIKGFLTKGDHVLFTAMEHNSVLRPLGKLRLDGLITTSEIPCFTDGFPDLDYLEGAYQPNTRLLVINHASNVTGTIMPLKKMIASAHTHGVMVLVDAAQTAGSVNIDVVSEEIDMLAFTGHKSLLGPTGTGGLYVKPGLDLRPLREGGTGSQSELDQHPETMPERLEAGTLNSVGLAGLLEGIRFIRQTDPEEIRKHEMNIRAYLYEGLREIEGVRLYGSADEQLCSCIVSFTLEHTDCGEVGYILENSYGILCRTGLHCAPLAHKAIGTFPEGTVRLSPGFFSKQSDIDFLLSAIQDIAELATR